MRTTYRNLTSPTRRNRRRHHRAFTLVELMIAMTIFMFVIGGIVYAHLAGVKMYETSKMKLGASDQARGAVHKLISEIRTAKRIQIGHGSGSGFDEIAAGQPQTGTALQIYPSTNATEFIRYYLKPADQSVYRQVFDSRQLPAKAIVEFVENTDIFTSENHLGVLLTDNQNNRVIGVHLEFNQIQYPITEIGEGHYFVYYKLRTKVTRRSLE